MKYDAKSCVRGVNNGGRCPPHGMEEAAVTFNKKPMAFTIGLIAL
jgi:hypothetical protein